MESGLIRVAQLPIIEERLRELKERVDAETAEALSLVCTEETVQAVKAKRAELRKRFEELENQRKQVKAAVMAPLEQFDKVYKECVSNAFKTADADLKRKIDETEGEIKGRCEDGLRDYFNELCAAYGLDWLEFEMSGVKVDMASAKQKTQKKLKEQLSSFVSGVSKDVEALSSMEHADELLAAYKGTLDVATAISMVEDYHRRVKAEEEARKARDARKAVEDEAVRKVEALAPPTVQVEQEKMTVTFTVTDTRERLIALREWMKANGYQYK